MKYQIALRFDGDIYSELLTVALDYCSQAILVIKDNYDLTSRCKTVLKGLSEFGLSIERTNQWPNTKLLWDQADVYRFSYTKLSRDFLYSSSNGNYAWRLPDLPEDLCLFRTNGAPWFVSTSHEKVCYFDIGENEILNIDANHPLLSQILTSP